MAPPTGQSADAPLPGREIGDITLPEKVDTITVWLRHQAEDSKGVGYLWIKLEDLSMPPLETLKK
jgi:hypothetical protein